MARRERAHKEEGASAMSSGSGGQVSHRLDRDFWEGRYWQGGRRRSVYAKTKRDAQDKLRQALANAEQGIGRERRSVTVEAYLEEWLASSVRPRLRPATIASYEDTVRRYIVPPIGR